ncbi:ADP-ribosylglycohydrolase family protein [Streptomyces sp. ISL-86]|uniref:ADP-ribosylglycohydrolase family protein n=1 Tax=Streptomyces sp. ISL-86 TaxID=2819187 RepID=UPI001BEB7798|nr:ADP-ribosylglycohydrolase family protein [Streptomyces sp. ISL-86]MBT2453875.1 ADP-ribosylglycohydrolase family protein [Streptomyces sp. ISL-86]
MTRPPAHPATPVRLTWVQPEDLVGHELRQAAEDSRDPAPLLRAWLAAGGHEAPARAGASPTPAPPELRALASRLLAELAELPSPLAPHEPHSWRAITATWPTPPPRGDGDTSPAPPLPETRARPLDRRVPDPALRARLEAAWVGRAVGCVLGKPVEKLPLDGIRALARAARNWPLDSWFTARRVPAELLAAYPWNRRSAPTSLAENIDGTPEDDDLNYPVLGLLLLQRYGKHFTTADVGRLWLDELPAGRTFTAERVAYRNLLLGLEPPATATHHNPFREWIGALIRADVHGWTHPGDPAAAAAQAYRDAALTHSGNGVYAALFTAAAIAEAASGRADVHTALQAGLAVVPPRSRLAEAVRFAIATAHRHRPRHSHSHSHSHPPPHTHPHPHPHPQSDVDTDVDTGFDADFDTVVDQLHARYGHYHWVHAVPNTALIAAALTHADGDFTHSICRAVSGGWDTDSNGATAGSLAGILAGAPENLPHRWTAPLKNRLATTVPGFDGIGFDTLAHLTAQEAARS